jgi:short-subunit dehydrogenase
LAGLTDRARPSTAAREKAVCSPRMARFHRPAARSVAVVTGASSGIGRAFARELARRGHPVVAVARRRERLDELADAARGGAPIVPLALDVTADDAPAAIRAAAAAHGEVGWLVNNAGASTFGRFETGDPARERGIVRLNCESLVALTSAFLPDLVRRGRGIVLNVASTAGFQATPGWAVYGATKAFVLSFSEALYEELRGSGVSATALCPGPVGTEFFSSNAGDRPHAPPFYTLTPEACAAAGLRAALAGRAVAIVGAVNRVQAWSSRLAPRAMARWVSGKIGLGYIGLPPLPKRRPLPIDVPRGGD